MKKFQSIIECPICMIFPLERYIQNPDLLRKNITEADIREHDIGLVTCNNCSNHYCQNCFEMISQTNNKCPMCRTPQSTFKNTALLSVGVKCLKFMQQSNLWSDALTQDEEFAALVSKFLQQEALIAESDSGPETKI